MGHVIFRGGGPAEQTAVSGDVIHPQLRTFGQGTRPVKLNPLLKTRCPLQQF